MRLDGGFAGQDEDAVHRLLLALCTSDRQTAEHTMRVAESVRILADGFGFDEETIELFATAAVLHDLGKIAVPESILNKPGALTDDESRTVREHAAIGAEMVGRTPALAAVAAMVRHHHERIDGGGYPDGLRGSQIPLGARLIAVADAFDAIVSDRPYRAARSVEIALAELGAGTDTQFDGAIVARFIDLVRKGSIPVRTTTALDRAERVA